MIHIYILPVENWLSSLAEILNKVRPGDAIQVRSADEAELAARAMKRMRVSGVEIEVKEPKP